MLQLNLSDPFTQTWNMRTSPMQVTPSPLQPAVNPTDLMPYLSSGRNPQTTTSIPCVNYGQNLGAIGQTLPNTFSSQGGRVRAQVSAMEQTGQPNMYQGGLDSPGNKPGTDGYNKISSRPGVQLCGSEQFGGALTPSPSKLYPQVDKGQAENQQTPFFPTFGRPQNSMTVNLKVPPKYTTPLYVNTGTSSSQATTPTGAAYTSNVNIVLSNPSTPTTQPLSDPSGVSVGEPSLYLAEPGGSYDNPTYDLPELSSSRGRKASGGPIQRPYKSASTVPTGALAARPVTSTIYDEEYEYTQGLQLLLIASFFFYKILHKNLC